MRSANPLRSLCLLGLVTSIALLGIGAMWPMPAADVALGNGSSEGSAATRDRDRIDPLASSPRSSRLRDDGQSTMPRNDATVRPLVDLSLLTAPTAAGASLVAERLTYAPGATFSVPRYTQVRVVSLAVGSLDAHIDGVAFLDRRWPAGSLLAREPHRVEGVVHLHPGDLLAIPAEAAFTARNPGEVPAVSLEVSVRLPRLLTPMTDRIGGVPGSGDVHIERLAATIATAPGISALVSVARVILPAGGNIVADRTAGLAVFVVEPAFFRPMRDGVDVEREPGEAGLVPRGALATIHTNGEAPLAGVLLTIIPTESGPSRAQRWWRFPLPISPVTRADERRADEGATAGVPVWVPSFLSPPPRVRARPSAPSAWRAAARPRFISHSSSRHEVRVRHLRGLVRGSGTKVQGHLPALSTLRTVQRDQT